MQEGLSDAELIEFNDLQTQLDSMYMCRAEGAFIRSRTRWLGQGKQSKAYFKRILVEM